ncbi:3-oxoacyl-ACP reductase FabG [Fuerstiella marisgermanici]|uniref:3-oxoacyl-[acyl-carrier-protein] reductase FabG n=1 Tax=Fuerstiella marisgermanici TaxID=1891926 RepID=A0A1P8WHX4_9PLAN|nr:3-oxoacyl-ACP reductase FabG [Fuerstiella marisgermanici]APZ93655.1 3-oxoacyl-[acyl-carrier-protein] reductase FabG [Fuerstiella marisgermanici]
MIPIDLKSKTAVVTGGGQGLGKQTAETLHKAGANVAVCYFHDSEGINQQRAEETALQLGARAIAVEGDVRSRESIGGMFDRVVEEFGSLDIVINNAAILRDRSFKKMSDDEWDSVIDTNLSGVFRVCKEAAPRLSDGGRIVSMASISGFTGFFGQTNYSSAKAGVVGFTKALSKELASRRITVNAVAPGVVLTEMGESIPEAARDEMLKQIPLNRFGTPEEISNAILFLCSPLADYITGQTIHVNGGWLG